MTDTQDVSAVQDTLQSVGLGEYFKVTAKGLDVRGQPSFEQCESLWETLVTVHQTIQMAIGDAMKYFRERWGDKADQIISDRTGWTLSTLHVYENTAKNVPKNVRRLEELSYSHHQAVAALPPQEQDKYLTRAVTGSDSGGVQKPWSVATLKKAIKHETTEIHPVAFYLLVKGKNEKDRDKLQKELEGRGYICRGTERHGDSKEKEKEEA